jgi:hypothetical protein
VCAVRSFDPNDKSGSAGSGANRYVGTAAQLPYTVSFENLAGATAPAQDVVITDQLNIANVDLDTFSLGPITFGNTRLYLGHGLTEYAATVDLRPGKNLLVRVESGLNKQTGLITWQFASIDPQTGAPPSNALSGFLPPNKNPPEGDGSVLFSITPKRGLRTGTQIRNKASIVFDTNPAILTPEWVNTLDASPPVSRVLALAAQSPSNFAVAWDGSDAGAGIRAYDVYVSDNDGPYTLWQTQTTAKQATFIGAAGHSYRFFSIARDLSGNIEPAKSAPEASTMIPAPCIGMVFPLAATVPAQGQVLKLTVSAASCTWSASSNATWAQIYPLSGTGNADFDATVFPNFSTRSRTAQVVVAGRTVTIDQQPSTGTADQRFVDLLYFSFLGRMPTTPERELQVTQGLKPPATRTDLTMNFYNTEEFNLGGRFTAGLYVGVLARDAEFSGWLFQRNALKNGGITQLQLVTNFLNSLEFQQKYPNLTDTDFVRLMYRNILGREAGTGELNSQVAALPSVGRIGMANAFLNHPEFRGRTDARLTAFLLYATLLARDGTPDDLAFRRKQIEGIPPVPVRTLVESFLQTSEFSELLR